MRVVSMAGDHYSEKWRWLEPYTQPTITNIPEPYTQPTITNIPPGNNPFVSKPDTFISTGVSNKEFQELKKEFQELKKEVLEMKELLKKAIRYDEIHNQPECEVEEKIELLKKVAELVGVDLKDIFKEKQ